MALSRSPSPGASQDPIIDLQRIEAEEEASETHFRRQSPDLDRESSPFISPEGSESRRSLSLDAAVDTISEWREEGQESKSVLYLVLLTLSIGG